MKIGSQIDGAVGGFVARAHVKRYQSQNEQPRDARKGVLLYRHTTTSTRSPSCPSQVPARVPQKKLRQPTMCIDKLWVKARIKRTCKQIEEFTQNYGITARDPISLSGLTLRRARRRSLLSSCLAAYT